MKKIYRKEEGVSPVIATILMVAITVVLAATVYIMVAGIGGPGTKQIVGKIASTEKIGNDWKLTFSDFNPATNISSLKVILSDTTTGKSDTLLFTFSTSQLATASGTNTGLTVEYHDLAGNNAINTGDYLLVKSPTVGDSYTVTILDASGNQITTASFTA